MEKLEWCTKRDIKEITEVLAGVPGSADVNSWELQCKSGSTPFSKRVTHLQCMWLLLEWKDIESTPLTAVYVNCTSCLPTDPQPPPDSNYFPTVPTPDQIHDHAAG